MATWPTELPQAFEADSYTQGIQSGAIVTQMDSGPPKVRGRFTAVSTFHSGSMVMTKTEFATYFRPFYETTLLHGTAEFDFPDPFDTSETITVRWVHDNPAYRVEQLTPTQVVVDFAVEELP